jgi:hypothetical protein
MTLEHSAVAARLLCVSESQLHDLCWACTICHRGGWRAGTSHPVLYSPHESVVRIHWAPLDTTIGLECFSKLSVTMMLPCAVNPDTQTGITYARSRNCAPAHIARNLSREIWVSRSR